MIRSRVPGLLPPLTPKELLETSIVWSVAGLIDRVPDLREVKGQESAKRALEMAAASGHKLLGVFAP